MYLKVCNKKKLYLFVLFIALSQISEVSGWDWFNYWSYQLCHMLPWYKKLPWAISYADSLAYKNKRARVFKKRTTIWPNTVSTSPSTVKEPAEGATSPLIPADPPAPATERHFGLFQLDPRQHLDEEMRPVTTSPSTLATMWDAQAVRHLNVPQPLDDSDEQTGFFGLASSGLTRRRFSPFFLEWLPATESPNAFGQAGPVQEIAVQQALENVVEEQSWASPPSPPLSPRPPRPAPDTERRYGPFPLDLEQQLDYGTFIF